MNAYAKDFDKNSKQINLLHNDKEISKNIQKYGIEQKLNEKRI